MPQYYKPPIHVTTRGVPTYNGGESSDPTPFRAYLLKSDAQSTQVSISRYSSVLNSPDVRDRVTVIGVDAPITIAYGGKIWLETFYDRNLEPVFCIINSGPKWTAVTLDTANQTVESLVYPDELEFITKYDINNKIGELDATVERIGVLQQTVTDEVNLQKDMGFIDQERATEIIAGINEAYPRMATLVTEYKAQMNNFFSGAPTSIWKKLFRTYTPICYTTKDTNYKLDGVSASPGVVAPVVTPTVPTVTQDPIFKIVQQLNSDLLLVDICHQNRFPARLPIPYHRPVYNYVYEGRNEDEFNTR